MNPGLIPARAGTTFGANQVQQKSGAHPRSRGDHRRFGLPAGSVAGSSPLARGPLDFHLRVAGYPGLIPARAGTTAGTTCTILPSRAHPRSRGDHTTHSGTAINRTGSSPLARGPPRRSQRLNVQSGLIPARAGTTSAEVETPAPAGAHPRSRGDHASLFSPPALFLGSSPLARGPPAYAPYGNGPFGLIPARAGTTSPRGYSANGNGAHPRSRGDHELDGLVIALHTGSSPLARGPLHSSVPGAGAGGLIPARAGTTPLLS